MKRKSLIVLLVLLLVGILAFTVFACNNNKKPDNPGTDTPGGDGPGPDDENPPEEETYAITEALPKLVTGIDKVAATVGDIEAGKGAYLGADIGLNFGVTADGLDVAADLVLSLKVSVDEDTAANNWALIGLKSDNKDVAQLYIRAVAANKEVIYIKEAFTGSKNWKVLSVLDVSEKPDLEGLFTGSNYGLIGKLFSLVTGLTAEDSTFPIDFTADSPIGGLEIEIMEGSTSTINQLLGTVKLLGKVVDGALHAEAFDNGNRYVATLNRAGIGDLIGGLMGSFDLGDLVKTLEKLNPVLRLVLGMEVKDGKFNVLKYDDPADAPVLDIEFSVDPETAALTDLSIDFANGDIEGMGIKLGLALSNIELSDESKAPDTETAGAEALGINLELQAKLPAWATTASAPAATIAVSVDPKAVIGWNAKDGSIEIDLSAVQGHATFNGNLIAEYTTNAEDKKGFAITLKPVYEFIAKDQTGDLRDQVYFIPCDLAAIVTAALNPTNDAGTETIQNAAFAEQIDLSGTLGTLVETIQAMIAAPTFDIASIGNIIGPALTDSNSIVKLLLAEITTGDSITFDPELGEDITTSASVTVNASALVDFVMGDNLLGGEGFDKLLNIQLYDFSAARDITAESAADVVKAANEKKDLTLDGIFAGDIIEVALDLIYTTMYEGQTTYTTFVDFAKEQVVDDDFISAVADKWGITAITNDGKLNVSEIGNITASIHLGNGIHVTLEALGAYVSLGGDLNSYKAPTGDITGDFKVITSWNDFNADGGLQNALMELAEYALGVEIAA